MLFIFIRFFFRSGLFYIPRNRKKRFRMDKLNRRVTRRRTKVRREVKFVHRKKNHIIGKINTLIFPTRNTFNTFTHICYSYLSGSFFGLDFFYIPPYFMNIVPIPSSVRVSISIACFIVPSITNTFFTPQFIALTQHSTLGIIPPAITPSSISSAASPVVS